MYLLEDSRFRERELNFDYYHDIDGAYMYFTTIKHILGLIIDLKKE